MLLYIGPLRPPTLPDQGLLLLEGLLKSRHRLRALILKAGDPLEAEARKLGIHVSRLPGLLTKSRRRIAEQLEQDDKLRRKIVRWVKGLEALEPDIGVVYYGYWIPSALFEMPPLGFLNYHPAPLPELRGMEPDTMAVLQGRQIIRGTVHQVTRDYDDGPIYAQTRAMRLTRYTTPLEIFERLSRDGARTILRVLDRIALGTASATPQRAHHAQDATRESAYAESTIRWADDTHAMIERRRRAFIGQDIGIRLKALIDGQLRMVEDLETHPGAYPGKPGDLVGRYCGRGAFAHAPILRTTEGVAVVQAGAPIKEGGPRIKEPGGHRILPPGRRARKTRREIVRRSVPRESGRQR